MRAIGQAEVALELMIRRSRAHRFRQAAYKLNGGCGVSDDVPLAAMYSAMRTLRLADGPDEVHCGLIAKFEMKKPG